MAEGTRRSSLFGGAILAAATGVTLLLVSISRLFAQARTGFEFTDESMYLLSADAAGDASFHNAFGAYTGLLLDLVGGDIVWFRRLGVVLLAAAGLYLGDRVVVFVARDADDRAVRVLGATFVATGALHYFLLHLTPSYNWLNVTGTTLGLAGLLHLLSPLAVRRWIPGALTALGTIVGFMGKFSAPAALAAVAAVLLVLAVDGSWSARLRPLVPAGISLAVLLVAHHLLVDPWPTTIDQIREGSNRLLILDPEYTLGAQVTSIRRAVTDVLTDGVALLSPVLVGLLAHEYLQRTRGRRLLRPDALAAISVATTAAVMVLDDRWIGGVTGYRVLAWVGVGLVLTGVALLAATRSWRREAFAVAIAGAALASAYAVGSNNGFLVQLNGGTVFLFAGALGLLAALPRAERALPVAVLAIVAGLASQFVITDGQADPYRQPPYDSQTTTIEIAGTDIRIHPQTAEFAAALRTDAAEAGWTAGTPLLDLSPYAAGVLVLLDASAPPSILVSVTGYRGQQDLAEDALGVIVEREEVGSWREAWILTAETATRPGVEPSVLAQLGRSFPDDYERVGVYALDQADQTLALWRPNDT